MRLRRSFACDLAGNDVKIVCITTSKNECDVVESFIRHNSRFCDHFCLIDESKDATRDILQNLRSEGFSIDIFNPGTSDYQQEGLINACLDAVRQSRQFDWAVFLDADEILPDVTRPEFEALLAGVPARTCAALGWQTYVPLSLDYFTHEDPLVTNFRPRSTEPRQWFKVMVPASLFADARVAAGNHRAYLRANGETCATVNLPLRLAHFPVRSIEQISLKNILACHTLTMKRNRKPGEGSHVYMTLNDLRRANFAPGYEQLRDIALKKYVKLNKQVKPDDLLRAIKELLRDLALKYADIGAPDCTVDVDEAAPALRSSSAPLRFPELARPNVIAIFDREIEFFARKILQYREANVAAIESLGKAEAAAVRPSAATRAQRSRSGRSRRREGRIEIIR